MEKKKLRLQVKDNRDNISGVYIRYFRVEPAVSTLTLLHPASVSRRGVPGTELRWTEVLHLPCTCVLFGTKTRCFPEFERLALIDVGSIPQGRLQE